MKVRYGGVEKEHTFTPGKTIHAVYEWAAGDHGFALPAAQRADHGLFVPGSQTALDTDMHVGVLAHDCQTAARPRAQASTPGLMTTGIQAPDERAFRAHVGAGRFMTGVERGRWELIDINWPYALIKVAAAPRDGAPDHYLVRFELIGYPTTPATACLWDAEEERLLTAAERPKVTWTPSPFRDDWENGRALYLPCDRIAIAGHANWPVEYPGELWDPDQGISKYLLIVYRLLNDGGYAGV